MKISIFVMTFLLTAATAFGAGTSDVTGYWKTEGGDSWLEIFRCGDAMCANVAWLKVPKYIDSQDGPVGKMKVDRKNPDPALRNRPILGLQVMKGFTAKDSRRWANGTCYNPQSGKTYKSKMYLASANRLEVRGFIGISLIGKTHILTR
jgi:uncharacterized protein (DUF2147 family)